MLDRKNKMLSLLKSGLLTWLLSTGSAGQPFMKSKIKGTGLSIFFKKTSKIWRTIERRWTQQNFPKLRIVSTSGSSKRVVTRQSQMKSFGKKPTFLNKEIWRKKILWPIKDSWRNSRNGLGFGCWGSLVWCRISKGLLYVFENKLSLLFGEKTAIVLGKQTSSWWERLQHSFQKAE